MPIEPAQLARSLGALGPLDLQGGLPRTLQQVLASAKTLLDADRVGLMLVDQAGALRWACGSDRLVEADGPQPGNSHRAVPGGHENGSPAAAGVSNTRFFGTYQIDPERYARDFSRVSQEILQQLTAVDGVDLEVTIEIQARRPDGFPADKVRVVLENARTLRFDQFGFESA